MTHDEMQAALRDKAAAADGLGAVILFDLGPDGHIYLDGKQTPPAVSGAGADPDTTVIVSAADFTSLLEGQLNPMAAFGSGALRIKGDMGPAMKLGALFG